MRPARLLSMLLVALTAVLAIAPAALLAAPEAAARPPLRLPSQIVDEANVLGAADKEQVGQAIDRLYQNRQVRLWVVYVDSFSGQNAEPWAQATLRASDLGEYDALLAVATADRAYAFLTGSAAASNSEANTLRRNQIEPALRDGNWAAAAVAAADGLDATSTSSSSGMSWSSVLAIVAVLGLGVLGLLLWARRRTRKRREADLAAAQRVDPTDPTALAAVPLETLDELSRSVVVEVDNAVRTSDNELTLAVEEFGEQRTAPFTAAVTAARTALTQAFNARQILDDTVPETPAQRRDLLTRVIVAAAKADRELDTQREAFAQLRDLVINAPARLDVLTQKMVDLTTRIAPAEQALADLSRQFAPTALHSVADNVDTAKQRLAFADQNITNARALVARPAGQQAGLVDSVRAAESALGQARTMLDAIDSAADDINRAIATLPEEIADVQAGIAAADAQLSRGGVDEPTELKAARDAAAQAVATAQESGNTDPLGAFSALTQADADLDRLLALIAEERQAQERLRRSYEQALTAAQSRVRGVGDFIDTRRGSVGPEARTRLAEAVRQLQAAQDKAADNSTESLPTAIAHANSATSLAMQAQQLANNDVSYAHQAYNSQHYGGGSNSGAVLGGIIIGNILSGALRGGIGGSVGGGSWRSTSFGGSGGGGFGGGGGRF
ncbi:TPM domain-containing protein [Mycolicibacterium sp. 22603]|uniref:TPM domain-containing protein n=1 Tax=Mycolicibacterium sp. 22603 TaxID=3453950 RepID=UPI003F8785A8